MRAALILSSVCLVGAQTVTVVVDEGYVSRHRTVGTVAHVWAQQNTATRVFAGWTGAVQHLADPGAPYTTFVVPNAEVRLRATYRAVPAWTPLTGVLGGVTVTYYIPANPAGLVFLFHGTGGSGSAQFTSSEFGSLTRDLVAAGFGVAAFDCLNRQTVQWDTATVGAANPDVVRLNSVINAMRTAGTIGAQLPLLAFGHSNGGQFSHFSAGVMNWAAISISCVQGSLAAASAYRGPVAWWMGKNDDHPQVGAPGIATSLGRYELHVNRGVHGRHMISGPMPLYPERIARSPFLTMADSVEIYNIFKANNWLDANDFLVRNPNNPAELNWGPAMPARLTEGQRLAVSGQLEGTYAGHEFVNFTPHITTGLFLRGVGRGQESRPVSGASFAGTAVAPESIATIFVGGLASGLEVGANGPEVNLRGVRGALRTGSNEAAVPWFFVSPGQGSFLVPAGTAVGNSTLKIESGDSRWAFPTAIAATSPGIFTANGNGQGAPAAILLRVSPDNTRSTEFPFAAGASGFVAAPIRFGDDRLFLDLYATGVRGSTSVEVVLGTQAIAPLYAGAQPQYPGLDQVTFELPRSFAGAGRLDAWIVSGGVRSNVVELNFGN